MTNADLRFIYKKANKLYWHNKLPKDLPVYFEKMKRSCYGVTKVFHQAQKPHSIRINKEIRGQRALCILTVLHEMCHVEFPRRKGHQGWHDRRMLKLAKSGAFNGLW